MEFRPCGNCQPVHVIVTLVSLVKMRELYEASKQATSKRQYLALGGTAADFRHDLAKSFIDVA